MAAGISRENSLTRSSPIGIREAVAALSAPAAPTADVDRLRTAVRGIEVELRNLTSALAAGGDLAALVEAIRDRETRRAGLERQLVTVSAPVLDDPVGIERALRSRVAEWREMFTQHTQLARQALQKLLTDKILCTPKEQDGAMVYELRARIGYDWIFRGILPIAGAAAGCPRGLASPHGSAHGWTVEREGVIAA
ncbi:MAG: hypothetical protein ABL982_13190 [Vicinamibacterales bacterium]